MLYICKFLKISRSGYYKWRKNKHNREELEKNDQKDFSLIFKVFKKGNNKLGWRRIKMHLFSDYGVIMNHKKIQRIMRKYNLKTKIRKRNPYKEIAKKTQEHSVSKNILQRKFNQEQPRLVFCTDITYLHYGEGKRAYLSAIKDIATKEIVSWEVSSNISLEFVLESVRKIKCSKNISPLMHSDQGFHYTNPAYICLLKSMNITQSMSRKGNCLDNAPIESFFGHLKDEIDYKSVKNCKELSILINKYMHYYNHKRYQWGLKKMTPVQYKNHLLKSPQ